MPFVLSRMGPAAVVSVFGLTLAACGPLTLPTTQAAPGASYPVIRTPVNLTPTVPPLAYTVGAWPSNSSPYLGAPVTVYVSFRNGGSPVGGGQAYVTVHYPGSYLSFGPAYTGGDGYTGIPVPGSAAPTPIVVDVSVSYLGQTYTTTTGFTPISR
jgi:hypothetical protein